MGQFRIHLIAVGALALGGCSGLSGDEAGQQHDLTAFQAALARAYTDLADSGGGAGDRDIFEQKAFYARNGTAVPPEQPAARAD